jgi:hypothetical protein
VRTLRGTAGRLILSMAWLTLWCSAMPEDFERIRAETRRHFGPAHTLFPKLIEQAATGSAVCSVWILVERAGRD